MSGYNYNGQGTPSAAWTDHINKINALIAANPVQRYTPPATPVSTINLMGAPDIAGQIIGGQSEQGERGGNTGLSSFDGPPGDMNALLGDMAPSWGGVGRGLGSVVGGLLGGPVGSIALGYLGGKLGGMVGAPSFDPSYGPQVPSGEPGSFGSFGGPNAAAESSAAADAMGGNANANSAGDQQAGYGYFQNGGYTGAGRDGIVQPSRRAGIVHEGEIVLSHPMVRRMGLLG